MKVCTKCKIEKELTEFDKRSNSKDGLRYECKSCRKKYREENKEQIKKWREENKEQIKKWREENKEYYKKWREENKEYYKKWCKENKDYYKKYRKEYEKKYREENKEYYKKYYKKWRKEKLKTDPIFKLTQTTRNLLSNSFRRACNGQYRKSKKTEEILGCDMNFFMRYIKSKFQKGMTFKNHGEWHLDHVIPISSANTEEEIIALNHYTNLQPLWADENLTKSNKILEQQLVLL